MASPGETCAPMDRLICPRCSCSLIPDPFDMYMCLCTGCRREWYITILFDKIFFSRLERA